jgi:hypothetical protein
VSDSVLASVRATFRAVACTVVPEAGRLDGAGWGEVEGIVEGLLARRPRAVRRQVVTFVRLLDVVARVRHRRALVALDARRRLSLIERVERAPLLLVRRGMWGLRTLILMGYYARPAAAAEVGWSAHRRGWAARGDTIAVIPLAPPEVWVEPRAVARDPDSHRPDDVGPTIDG